MIAIAGVVVGTLLFLVLLFSRIAGTTVAVRLAPPSKSARAFIKSQLGGQTATVGRWAWDFDGETFYLMFGVLWKVPARWSLKTFNIVLLDRQVNGK
jgi:hypothetical protein